MIRLVCLILAASAIGSSACDASRPVLTKSLMAKSTSESDLDLLAAEAFIDAFYSWDADALTRTLDTATLPSEEAARVLYYQGWAEAGDYRIQNRRPCARSQDGRVECSITVTDDIGKTLGYVATDVFHLSIEAGRIVGVAFDSDDPPVFDELFAWMAKDRPEVFTGPCKDLFSGGTTPSPCVKAVVKAARDFLIASPRNDHPAVVRNPEENEAK